MSDAPPIQRTLERVSQRVPYLNVALGPKPEGWVWAADMLNDPDLLRRALDAVCAMYRTDNRQIGASFLVLGYFWYPACAAAACFLLDQRVPDLSPAALAVSTRGGIQVTSPRFWALPNDPECDHPDAIVVASRDELRRRMADFLHVQHAAPLFPLLRSIAPYGMHAMRANYVDRVVSAVIWVAETIGDDDLLRREVAAMLELIGPDSRTGLLEVTCDGRTGLFLRRGGCCLNYRIPGNGKCDTCPLIPLPQRQELLRNHMRPAATG